MFRSMWSIDAMLESIVAELCLVIFAAVVSSEWIALCFVKAGTETRLLRFVSIHTLSEYVVSILCHITQGENWLYIDIDAKTHQSRMCYPNPIYTTEDLTNTHACMHAHSIYTCA
jgi:hypothetical protein